MKKTKMEKGITLIALIITIIILLILAVVTIGSIKNSNIIAYAQNASSRYESEKEREESTLSGYEDLISESTRGTWVDNGDSTFTSGDGITVKLGDYVNYNEGSYKHTPDTTKGAGTSGTTGASTTEHNLGTSELTTEDLSWRVFGVNERGQLELISADPTNTPLYLANDEGYINAEENLNTFCNDLYGKGTYASGARSLNVKDINNLTGYNPMSEDSSYNSIYGVNWIYRYPTEAEMGSTTRYMQYSTNNGNTWNNITDTDSQTFRVPGENTILSSSNSEKKEITSSEYAYIISDALTTYKGYPLKRAQEISNVICLSSDSSSIFIQWLASKGAKCSENYVSFDLYIINGEQLNCEGGIYKSNGTNICNSLLVRPVVTLKSNVSIVTNDSENSISNMWTLR